MTDRVTDEQIAKFKKWVNRKHPIDVGHEVLASVLSERARADAAEGRAEIAERELRDGVRITGSLLSRSVKARRSIAVLWRSRRVWQGRAEQARIAYRVIERERDELKALVEAVRQATTEKKLREALWYAFQSWDKDDGSIAACIHHYLCRALDGGVS